MAGTPLPQETYDLIWQYYQSTGSISAAARMAGVNRTTAQNEVWRRQAREEAPTEPRDNCVENGVPLKYPTAIGQDGPLFLGTDISASGLGYTGPLKFEPLEEKTKTRFLLTAAQNNTAIHEGFWANLQAYAAHIDAEIIVGGFIYRKDAQGQRGQEKTHERQDERSSTWDPRLDAYRVDVRREIAPGLIWAGEMNALPTNADPLAGLLSYSRGDSAIFPHVKVAMRSIATSLTQPPKFVYTTGAITVPNYIQRKAGQIAEFHHVIGALIVEVDGTDWWVRQLNATDDGTFQDLDTLVKDGRVTEGHRLLAVNWGDVHVRKLDPEMFETCWGTDRDSPSIIDETRPQYQFYHDILDAEGFNPHDADDHFARYDKHVRNRDNVRDELDEVADFMRRAHRDFCEDVVVPSNHNDMLLRWLKRTNHKLDPRNARFYHEASLAYMDALDNQDVDFDLLAWYLRPRTPAATYPSEANPTFILKGIEYGLHGHRGPNGVRGTDQNFRSLGTKVTKGHTHSATIYDGVYTAGVQARLYHGYNKGLSSWSNSMVFTYPTGKRAIITMRGLRYRGPSA